VTALLEYFDILLLTIKFEGGVEWGGHAPWIYPCAILVSIWLHCGFSAKLEEDNQNNESKNNSKVQKKGFVESYLSERQKAHNTGSLLLWQIIAPMHCIIGLVNVVNRGGRKALYKN